MLFLNLFLLVSCEVGHLRLVDRRLHLLRKVNNAKKNYKASTSFTTLNVKETSLTTSVYYLDTSHTSIQTISEYEKSHHASLQSNLSTNPLQKRKYQIINIEYQKIIEARSKQNILNK
jgi:hypothetical protein